MGRSTWIKERHLILYNAEEFTSLIKTSIQGKNNLPSGNQKQTVLSTLTSNKR